jgi:phosphatidate cytidylyltransferase
MTIELKKRIITSVFLFTLLLFMYIYTYILIVSLIIIALIAWIEFYGLISKIFYKNSLIRFLLKSFSLMYLSLLVIGILYVVSNNPELKIFFVYSILVSIASDIGGLIFGKIFKGKKLTKISPKKTISGSLGSFFFSLMLIPFFIELVINHEILSLMIITAFISLITQIGDLFISFIKRKAKVKDTSDLLPGHGGILDRIDGIIFAVPIGFLLLNYF